MPSFLKTLLTLLLFFFAKENNYSQDFDQTFKDVKEKFENYTLTLNELDSVISFCPNINEYPRLLFYKGELYFDMENYPLHIKYLSDLNEHIEEYDFKYDILNNLGLSYGLIEKFDLSRKYHQESYELAKKNKDSLLMNKAYENILLLNIENGSGTVEDILEYEKFFLSKNYKDNYCEKLESFSIILEYYLLSKNYEKADAFFNKVSVGNHKKYESCSQLILNEVYAHKAVIEIHKKNYKLGLTYLDTIPLYKIKLDADKLVAYELYKKTHDLVGNQEIANKYNDSIITILQKNITRINNSNIDVYSTLDKNINSAENKISGFKIILYITITLFIGIVIFFLIKNKRQKKREIKLTSELILNKGEYNKTLQNNINFKKEVKTLLKEKNFSELQKVQKKYEIEDFNNEVYIKYLVSEIEPSFINKLQAYNITFSEIEKLVLYYRKRNYTYKEISIITNRTLRSIQGLSYRLSKKTTAEIHLNLTDFLKKM